MDYFFIAPLPSYITGRGDGLRAQSAKTSSLNQLLIHGEGVRWRYDFTGEQGHVAQARGECRFGLNSGLNSDITPSPKGADTVAKVESCIGPNFW